jgi:hypothetical protein
MELYGDSWEVTSDVTDKRKRKNVVLFINAVSCILTVPVSRHDMRFKEHCSLRKGGLQIP